MRYWPVPSVTDVRVFSINAGLDASMVTPGSTAPDASFTLPAIDDWACATAGSSRTIAGRTHVRASLSTERTSINRLLTSRDRRDNIDRVTLKMRHLTACLRRVKRFFRVFTQTWCDNPTERMRIRYGAFFVLFFAVCVAPFAGCRAEPDASRASTINSPSQPEWFAERA